MHVKGEPDTLRSQFAAALNGAVSFTGLSSSVYKEHSFKIEAAT